MPEDKMEAARERVAKCAEEDGSLHEDGWYLNYESNGGWNEKAVLDGRFTAEELVAIAEHMRRVQEATKDG